MNNKELIINLIQQDLKHSQLLSGLEKIGLDGTDLYYLEMSEIIAKLMKVPNGRKIGDLWGETYIAFLHEAIRYKVTSRGETLKPLAIACYGRLQTIIEGEN